MNIELSKNNHLKWGYNGIPWITRNSAYDKFFIEYGTIKKQQNFRQACIDTATEISILARTQNKIPLIFFSGGIDSEAIIYSFLLADQKFRLAHIKYLPNLNDHEFPYVENLAKKYNLDLDLYYIDVYEFLSREQTFNNALRDNSIMIELQLLTCVTDKIKENFFPVLDHPGTYLYRDLPDMNKNAVWFYKDFEHLMFFYNHCLHEQISACPSFFHWSPEIIYSFLVDPLNVELINNRIPGKVTNRSSTLKLYQKTFPEFDLVQRPKYTGHEFVSKSFLNDLNCKLYRILKYDRYSGQRIECFEFIRQLKTVCDYLNLERYGAE